MRKKKITPYPQQNPDCNCFVVAYFRQKNPFTNQKWEENLSQPIDSVDSIFETVDSILEHLSEYGPKTIDLSWIDTSVNFGQLVAVLRSTYMWRDSILHWQHALNIAKDITKDHPEFSRELYGLST